MTLGVILMIALAWTIAGTNQQQDKTASQPLKPQSNVFDFGHIGINYTVHHKFYYKNQTDDTINITNVTSSCDCSSVFANDTLLAPDDTTFFQLKFNTRDIYGPSNKSFTVTTDSPDLPQFKYFYQSIIGQWFDGIRPDPQALMFLPKQGTKRIVILNKNFDRLTVSVKKQYDNSFEVTIPISEATRGKQLEIEITPSADLRKGTFISQLILSVDKGEDTKPTILTIPIKTVKY